LVFWLMALTAVGAGALALPGWQPIRPEHWATIAGMAVTGSIGQWAITEAFRRGEASVIAPYEYTALAWGVGLDWVLWHSVPTIRTLAGAAVVIASGVYLFRRERIHMEAEHP
jgi:drug/metabolite transporter (DMT)-like permease